MFLGAGEYVRVAELDGVEGVLAEQLHAEAGIAVQLALLFVVEGVQFLIDDLQGGAHGHGPAVALQYALVAAEHADAGADGGLRQIDRGDIGRLQLDQRRAQLAVQGVDELAAGAFPGVRRALAADEDDAGGEGVGTLRNRPRYTFCTHRPGAGDAETGADDGGEHGLPAGGGGGVVLVCLALLEGVVNGDGDVLAGVLIELTAGAEHAVLEEIARLFHAAVEAVGRGDQLLRLGHEHGAEEFGIGAFQRLPHPDVEKVGEVGIADVVVIGRVGGKP